MPRSIFPFGCPSCRLALTYVSDDLLRCDNGHEYARIDGIYRMLAPERKAYFTKFIREYELIRAKEDRGSMDSAYYRKLPYGVKGRWAEDWAIRAKSFKMIDVPPYEYTLDIGAGNCWLANRLASQGALVAAVDLQTNPLDGLGAHIHYKTSFTPIQAEFDRLPFTDEEFSTVIFNASLHYSENFETTLQEALRVLNDYPGWLYIVDTPIYNSDASGQRMLAERQAHFEQTYGFRSDALRSEGYLTHARLAELGKTLGITWKLIRPRYGLRWMIRRLIGRIRTRREPAEFYVILGTRSR